MRLLSPLPMLALVLAAACAGGGARTSASSADPGRIRRTSNLITADEIRDASVSGTAYELVQRLRPNFLRSRGTDASARREVYALVYVNGSRMGGLEALRQVAAADVQEIRFLIGPEAALRFGKGHEGGAILITLR